MCHNTFLFPTAAFDDHSVVCSAVYQCIYEGRSESFATSYLN